MLRHLARTARERGMVADGHDDFRPGREITFTDAPGTERVAMPKPMSARRPPPPLRTRGQKRRFCRDLAIAAGHTQAGLTHRQLAEIFGLPRSRIATILQAMNALGDAAGAEEDD